MTVNPDADSALHPTLYFLSVFFALLGTYAGVQGLRVVLATRGGVTRQKLFHFIIFLCCIVRAIFFAFVPTWDGVYFYVRMTSDNPVDTGFYVLEEFPTLVLVTLYSLQLLVWSQSYHIAEESVHIYKRIVIPLLWFFNICVYALQIVIWVAYDRTEIDSDIWSLIASVLHMFSFAIIASALLYYGIRVRRTIQSVPIGLEVRTKQMRAINFVTTICSVAFMVRCCALVAASFLAYSNTGDFDSELTQGDVAMSALFFLCTEGIPILTVLYYHRRIPGANRRRRSSKANTSSISFVDKLNRALRVVVRGRGYVEPVGGDASRGMELPKMAIFAGESNDNIDRISLIESNAVQNISVARKGYGTIHSELI